MEEKQNESKIKSLTMMRKNNRSYGLKDNVNRFFFPTEYMKFYEQLKDKQKHTVTFLLNTGARINEARHVQVADVDFANKRMTLRITKSKAKKGEKRGKTRIIPISTQFSRYLKKYSETRGLKDSDVFGVLSTPAVKLAMKKAATQAGLSHPEDFSAHTLRKTFEVWLMSLGTIGDLGLVAHLGHDIQTAASHYVSPNTMTYVERDKIRTILGDIYERRL
jgi:integrase